jgi:glutamine synthetase
VLRRIVELYAAQGWLPVVAPEMEFFLDRPQHRPEQPIIPPMGRSGRRAAGKQAYSMSAVDEYGKVIDDIYDFAEGQGLEIDGILQEGGAGQIEINLAHGDPVQLADEVFFFKRLIREAALRHDCFATFMAKPIEGEPGSAMHIHTSVVDRKTGKNIFAGPKGVRDRRLLALHRGHAEAPAPPSPACALREQLPPLREGLRRPDQPGMGPRQPHHGPAHPDLRAPPDGWKTASGHGLQPLPRHRGHPRLRLPRADDEDSEFEIPRSMYDALELFADAPEIREILGEEFCRVYETVKRTEYAEFLQVISPWEREHLLLNV